MQIEKLLEVKMMDRWKILESEVLLNLASHRFVIWTLVKLCSVYKYAGLLV